LSLNTDLTDLIPTEPTLMPACAAIEHVRRKIDAAAAAQDRFVAAGAHTALRFASAVTTTEPI
jgi:hypothetical protein